MVKRTNHIGIEYLELKYYNSICGFSGLGIPYIVLYDKPCFTNTVKANKAYESKRVYKRGNGVRKYEKKI